ncbi:hypothetical protein OBBRIDRAFT_514385 [Obba rivulosa]|uniref:Uncharacterized protein n=1 Tax=Obba rivulosa TaxID=1052685 RepID=A0A8E2DLM1_9APHY|nr:hypothetical protein OBBRIDRAFT_514385 [Obba rivulosa]
MERAYDWVREGFARGTRVDDVSLAEDSERASMRFLAHIGGCCSAQLRTRGFGVSEYSTWTQRCDLGRCSPYLTCPGAHRTGAALARDAEQARLAPPGPPLPTMDCHCPARPTPTTSGLFSPVRSRLSCRIACAWVLYCVCCSRERETSDPCGEAWESCAQQANRLMAVCHRLGKESARVRRGDAG